MDDTPRTRGAASLALWLAAMRVTQSDLARILDVSPSTVLHWVRGTRKPRRAAAERIAKLTHVDPWEWQRTDGVENIDDTVALFLREKKATVELLLLQKEANNE